LEGKLDILASLDLPGVVGGSEFFKLQLLEEAGQLIKRIDICGGDAAFD